MLILSKNLNTKDKFQIHSLYSLLDYKYLNAFRLKIKNILFKLFKNFNKEVMRFRIKKLKIIFI